MKPVPTPERIGKFVIQSVLGQGAMGVVYKALDPNIRRTVAIKTVHKHLLGAEHEQAAIAARFRNEAQAVGRLHHPGIVQIYEFGDTPDCAYIAMEYVEGQDLDQVLRGSSELLPARRACDIVLQLLDALDCAHEQGVWHRDVKPANLIVTNAGPVKLTDFGIARLHDVGLTQVASTIGTPGYMAPEQYLGDAVDHRVDIYAAGVLLYRLLAGSPAFAGTPEAVMYKVLHEAPKPLASVRPGGLPAPYDRQFDALIGRAMAKQRQDRWPSALEFRTALASLLPGAPAPAPRAGATALQRPTAPPPLATPYPAPAAPMYSPATSPVYSPAAAPMHAPTTAPSHAPAMAPINAPMPSPLPAPATQMRPGVVLSDSLRTRATALLTQQLGPVARVVVKRAAESAASPEDFVERVIDGVAAAEKPAMRRALHAML